MALSKKLKGSFDDEETLCFIACAGIGTKFCACRFGICGKAG
jgi:hypothetical protein